MDHWHDSPVKCLLLLLLFLSFVTDILRGATQVDTQPPNLIDEMKTKIDSVSVTVVKGLFPNLCESNV